MIEIEGRCIDEVFREAAAGAPQADFLVASDGAGGLRGFTYSDIERQVALTAAAISGAGYGHGERAAVLLGTCPEHYVLKLAMNRIGMSCVPINPDYRPGELAYVLADSAASVAFVSPENEALMRAACAELPTPCAISVFNGALGTLPPSIRPPVEATALSPASESCLLYTSGTTGKPKGCVLSHEYELMMGASYLRPRGVMAITGADRIFNPLPAFHVNAGVLTFFGAMLSGAALVQPPRFSASGFWRDIAASRASVFHYLGVVISVLMSDGAEVATPPESVRLGIGAGAEPSLHQAFERRFGIPLVELWGMTEMCRILSMEEEPRHIDTRAMGRPREDLEVQVWDDAGRETAHGAPGEMVLRHSAATPRKGFFSGYLGKPQATEEAWTGGWFHTGDTVEMDTEGIIYFVDRKKNIIRRAGENIAAAEVENILLEDERVRTVAVMPCPDETREEEVLAAIVLAGGVEAGPRTARSIFDRALARMAYYKPPGWVLFVEEIPVTGTQKVQKHRLFASGEDPRTRPDIHDLRAFKKRG